MLMAWNYIHTWNLSFEKDGTTILKIIESMQQWWLESVNSSGGWNIEALKYGIREPEAVNKVAYNLAIS